MREEYRAQAQECRESLFILANEFLGFKDVNTTTHFGIIRALEGDTRRKLICVPRGCLKSSIACVAYPIWLLIRDPNARILINSELYTNSKNFLREIKSHLESPGLTQLFGQFKTDPWNEAEITIRQRTKSFAQASVTAGGVGTTKVGQHYDYIIHDDLNSPENSQTPEACRKVIEHYKYSISILEPTGTMVLIGTRYSELDCIGYVLKNELGIDGIPKSGEYDTQGLIGAS